MATFVNRDEELQVIARECNNLQTSSALPVPIIQFHGINGIGKTTMLQKVASHCNSIKLSAIEVDASEDMPTFLQTIIDGIKSYGIQLSSTDPMADSISAINQLLLDRPAVILIDALESSSEKQISWIEQLLQALAGNKRLLFVLAGKKVIQRELSDRTRIIDRRLIPIQLKPFDGSSCNSYVSQKVPAMPQELHDVIFEWTSGYPLAINIMLDEMNEKQLDPRKDTDKQPLLLLLTEKVIHQSILAQISPPPAAAELDWYQTMLSIFAVARRYNLSIIRRMVEEFAPQYKYASSLAYINLPRQINQTADILIWNQARGGYAMETPIRRIFQKKLQIEQPEMYKNIHNFMARTTERLSKEVTGTDRVRYLLEYLYHSACCKDEQALQLIIDNILQQIINDAEDNPDIFTMFRKEFKGDKELRSCLSILNNRIISAIHQREADIHREVLKTSTTPDNRVFNWQGLFSWSILDPELPDVINYAQQLIQTCVKDEPVEVRHKLYEALARDPKIIERLGQQQVLAILSPLQTR